MSDLQDLWKSVSQTPESQQKLVRDLKHFYGAEDRINQKKLEILENCPFLERYNVRKWKNILSQFVTLRRDSQQRNPKLRIEKTCSCLEELGLTQQEIDAVDLEIAFDDNEIVEDVINYLNEFVNILHDFIDHNNHGNVAMPISDVLIPSARGNYMGSWENKDRINIWLDRFSGKHAANFLKDVLYKYPDMLERYQSTVQGDAPDLICQDGDEDIWAEIIHRENRNQVFRNRLIEIMSPYNNLKLDALLGNSVSKAQLEKEEAKMQEAIAGLNEEFQAMTKLDEELRNKYGRLESKENQAILDALSPEERALLNSFDKNLSNFNADNNYRILQDKTREWFMKPEVRSKLYPLQKLQQIKV